MGGSQEIVKYKQTDSRTNKLFREHKNGVKSTAPRKIENAPHLPSQNIYQILRLFSPIQGNQMKCVNQTR